MKHQETLVKHCETLVKHHDTLKHPPFNATISALDEITSAWRGVSSNIGDCGVGINNADV